METTLYRARRFFRLEPVNLDLVLLRNLLLNQEGGYFQTLITLKLDNFTQFFVFYYSAIASKLFLEGFKDSLLVKFWREALEGCKCLTAVTLLNSNI
jgi:hypothetical protein